MGRTLKFKVGDSVRVKSGNMQGRTGIITAATTFDAVPYNVKFSDTCEMVFLTRELENINLNTQ